MAQPVKETSIYKDLLELQGYLIDLRRNLTKDSLDIWKGILHILSTDAYGLFLETHDLASSEDKISRIRDLNIKFRVVENNINLIIRVETQEGRLERSFGSEGKGTVRFYDTLARLQMACDNWESYVKEDLRKQKLNNKIVS